eukprot:UN23563
MKILQENIEVADLHHYEAVLMVCKEGRSSYIAKQVMEQILNRKNLKFDIVTWNILFSVFQKSGDIGSMLYYKGLLSKNYPQYKLDAVTYNSIITTYSHNLTMVENKFDEALGFFAEMVKSGIKPNNYIMNSLLNVAAKSIGDEGKAFKHTSQVFSLMTKFQIKQDITCYNLLLSTANYKDAAIIWKRMKERFPVDRYSYGTILNTFAKAGKRKYFDMIWDEKINAGFSPSSICFQSKFNLAMAKRDFDLFHT